MRWIVSTDFTLGTVPCWGAFWESYDLWHDGGPQETPEKDVFTQAFNLSLDAGVSAVSLVDGWIDCWSNLKKSTKLNLCDMLIQLTPPHLISSHLRLSLISSCLSKPDHHHHSSPQSTSTTSILNHLHPSNLRSLATVHQATHCLWSKLCSWLERCEARRADGVWKKFIPS